MQSNVRSLSQAILSILLLLLSLHDGRVVEAALAAGPPKPKYGGGGGVGRFVVDEDAGKPNAWTCHYDMVLCERIQGKPPTESGLYVPQNDLPKFHLCRVLAVGPGREEENGLIAPMPDISVGSIVIAKNPWGIGPKDEETSDGKKLSYMRSQDIAAVIPGGLVNDDSDEE